MSVIEIVLIVAASVIGVAALVYGFFRKASRVSWIGWQVFLLFACTFLLDVIPMPEGSLGFWLTAGAFVLLLGLDLLLGGLIRSLMLKSNPGKHVRRLSRVSGALCSLLNIALLFAMFASLAFAVLGAMPTPPAALAPVLESAVWKNFLAKHALDLFLIAFCFVFTRAGLRLGVIRGIYYLLMYALTFGCFVGSILLATKVGFFANWGAALASCFTSLGPAAASVLGHGLFALLFFAVMFAVVMLLGWLLHKGLKKLIDVRPVGLISAILLFLLFLAVYLIFLCALYYGVAYLAGGMTQQFEFMGEFAFGKMLESLLTSSPLSAAFYLFNPLKLLLG